MENLRTVLVCRSVYCRRHLTFPTLSLSQELARYKCPCGLDGLPDLYPEHSQHLPAIARLPGQHNSPQRTLDSGSQRQRLISLLEAALAESNVQLMRACEFPQAVLAG